MNLRKKKKKKKKSNAMPWVFAGNTVIGSPTLSSSTSMHTHRILIHLVIIDDLTSQHSNAGLPFPKVRSRVTPEIAAVGENTPREWVLGPHGPGGITQSIPCCGKESVNPEERRPLLKTATSAAVTLRKSRVRSLTGG